VRKGQRRLAGLDEKILALYAGGMTTREIETYISDLYGPGVSRETVSRVTAAVLEDAKAWQTRPLEQIYPILYLDALVIKIRDGQAVRNFACYLAIGVNLEGERDVLGMWFQRSEGAKFWLQVLTDLRTRGVQDVLVCCVDGLTGFPEAIEAVFPQAWVQTCIVHAIRAALRFVPYRDKRKVAADLKKIYTAVDRDHAERELDRFAETWDAKYPMISASWIENWERIKAVAAAARCRRARGRSCAPARGRPHQPVSAPGWTNEAAANKRRRWCNSEMPARTSGAPG
jgi:putative transposase